MHDWSPGRLSRTAAMGSGPVYALRSVKALHSARRVGCEVAEPVGVGTGVVGVGRGRWAAWKDAAVPFPRCSCRSACCWPKAAPPWFRWGRWEASTRRWRWGCSYLYLACKGTRQWRRPRGAGTGRGRPDPAARRRCLRSSGWWSAGPAAGAWASRWRPGRGCRGWGCSRSPACSPRAEPRNRSAEDRSTRAAGSRTRAEARPAWVRRCRTPGDEASGAPVCRRGSDRVPRGRVAPWPGSGANRADARASASRAG